MWILKRWGIQNINHSYWPSTGLSNRFKRRFGRTQIPYTSISKSTGIKRLWQKDAMTLRCWKQCARNTGTNSERGRLWLFPQGQSQAPGPPALQNPPLFHPVTFLFLPTLWLLFDYYFSKTEKTVGAQACQELPRFLQIGAKFVRCIWNPHKFWFSSLAAW